MKLSGYVALSLLGAGLIGAPVNGLASEKSAKKEKPSKSEKSDKKAEKYPLTTCVVSDEKLGGDMGEPYVFTHEGQEVKLCCKSCLKDFKKEPAKYMKKIDEAKKKENK